MSFRLQPLHFPTIIELDEPVYGEQSYLSDDYCFHFWKDDADWRVLSNAHLGAADQPLHKAFNDSFMPARFRRRIDAVEAVRAFLIGEGLAVQ